MNRSLFVSAAVGSTLLALLTFGVQARALRGFDAANQEVLQRLVPPTMDAPLSILSVLGSFELTTCCLVALLFVFFRPRFRTLLLALFMTIVVVELLSKVLIAQPGPPPELSRYAFGLSLPTTTVATPFSFPSGHAARSMFLATVAFAWIGRCAPNERRRRALSVLLVLGEGTMLVSRVSLGDHWTTDVLGGALLGFLMALPVLAPPAGSRELPPGTAGRLPAA